MTGNGKLLPLAIESIIQVLASCIVAHGDNHTFVRDISKTIDRSKDCQIEKCLPRQGRIIIQISKRSNRRACVPHT